MEWEPVPFEGHRPVIPFIERQFNESPTLLQRVFDVTFGWLIWPFWTRIPGTFLGYVFIAVAVAWSLIGAGFLFVTLFGHWTGDIQFAAFMQGIASHMTALVFYRNGIRAIRIGRSSSHRQPVPANG